MSIKINVNVFLLLLLFMITKQMEIYALVMLFALLHELGHLCAGILMKFQVNHFKVLPLGFAVEFKANLEDYNEKIGRTRKITLKKLVINIAGPLVNLVLMIISIVAHWNSNIIYANLIIFLINMLPIYPLDGGRIIKNIVKMIKGNRIAEKFTNQVSNLFVFIFSIIASIAIYYYQNIAIVFALMVLWSMVYYENKRFRTYNKIYKMIDKQVNYRYNEEENIEKILHN